MLLEAGADREATNKVSCAADLSGAIARFWVTPQPRAALGRNMGGFGLGVVKGTLVR